FPEALFARDERFARVNDLDRGVGGNLAAVPQIAVVGGKLASRGGDENLIGSLRFVVVIGVENPTQARLSDVNTLRLGQIFAAQFIHGDSAEREGGKKPER